jgi:hypothetical protein
VCATGTQAAAGGVEREEVRGVEAGHDELGLGGDAAEAGDAAPEVDGGHHGLAALRGGHVRRAEERDLGGEERGLARRARLLRPEGGGGGREQRRQEAGEQEQAAETPLHGWDLSLARVLALLRRWVVVEAEWRGRRRGGALYSRRSRAG